MRGKRLDKRSEEVSTLRVGDKLDGGKHKRCVSAVTARTSRNAIFETLKCVETSARTRNRNLTFELDTRDRTGRAGKLSVVPPRSTARHPDDRCSNCHLILAFGSFC